MREGGSSRRTGRQSKGRQAREKAQAMAPQVQEKAQPVVEQTRGKAQVVRAQAATRIEEQVDVRSTQAGEQVRSVGNALRTTSEELRGQGQDRPAKVAEQAATRADQLGQYLREADGQKILRDAEDFARRQPWLVAAAGAAVGILAARFLKASSGGGEASGDGQRATVTLEETRAAADVPAVPPPDVGRYTPA